MTDYFSSGIIGSRYQLQESLGRGGMGVVYRAQDLLTSHTVALKQVTVPTAQLAFASRSGNADMAFALAQEFRTLATIRHPHIISVFDFGFDQQRQPYFTMEYLDGSQDVLNAGRSLAFTERIYLILQMLQALVYLHRRGILQRDLKPSNVLVVNEQVKLLDFGLSVSTSRTMEHLTQTTAGTLAYMAPELFQGAPYSQASDLYAVGVIAFELLTGHFPYDQSNLAILIHDVLTKQVDASSLGLADSLAQVLNRLLIKSREDRYKDAAEVITDLCAATGLPLPPETKSIRESFLQAAKFVGRENELSYLTDLLQTVANGQGNIILIGGESGVGKSRLLDELRAWALVEGILVLRGQAISDGRSPYQLWHDVIRMLTLYADMDGEEIPLLKSIVPDMGRLIKHMPSSLPRSAASPTQAQLSQAMSRLLGGLDQPAMVILEDLQWAGPESIRLLKDLAPSVTNQPLLVAGTYRADRSLPLLSELGTAAQLQLNRLTSDDIAELSESMLGPTGRDPRLVALLERETEGNAFFLVEAVRTLAKEAGQLDRIDTTALPDTIVAGGIQAILGRHLDRVPIDAQPLLQLASVAGRVLDLTLLQALEPQANLARWLAVCSDVAVIEAYGETWRFSHDKLREEIKDRLSHDLHHTLHQRVAEALESIYPNAPEQAAALAHHWTVAGDQEKALHYCEIAGHQAARSNANEEAITFFERALALLLDQPGSSERDQRELALLMGLGPPLMALHGFHATQVIHTYSRARELAVEMGQIKTLFQATWGQWEYYSHGETEDLDTAAKLVQQLFDLAYQAKDDGLLLEAHHSGWFMSFAHGNTADMNKHTRHGLAIYHRGLSAEHIRLYGHDPGVCAHGSGAVSLWLLGYPDQARQQALNGLALSEETGHPFTQTVAKWGATLTTLLRGESQEALVRAKELVTLAQENGFSDFVAIGEVFQTIALTSSLDSSEHLMQMRNNYQPIREKAGFALRPWVQSKYLESCLTAGALDEGFQAMEKELAYQPLSGDRPFESEIRRLYGELLLAQRETKALEAEEQFQLALSITQKDGSRSLELRVATSLARMWQKHGKQLEAHQMLAEIYNWFTEGFETADLVTARRLLQELA